MADGAYQFQPPGTDQYLIPPLSRSVVFERQVQQKVGSPVKNGIAAYIEDLSSRSRLQRPYSPNQVSQSMYNQGHQQGQNVFMNGAHGHQRYSMQMNASKPFQANQHHQVHAQRRQQQELGGPGHGTNYANHQYNASNSGVSTPQFLPNPMRNGTPNHTQNGQSRQQNENWQHQLSLHREAQEATGTHPHARNHPSNKGVGGVSSDQVRRDADREERTRTTGSLESDRQSWNEMDLGGQGLRALSSGLFNFAFLKKLYLNGNQLTSLNSAIGQLRGLTLLDLSKNKLTGLPAELGMLVNLKSLLLFDNELETLPCELGSLFQLEMLGIEGNPDMDPTYKQIVVEDGSRALISYLQDSTERPDPPLDRDWISVDETHMSAGSQADIFKVLSYNTLCDNATRAQFGYTPSHALTWEYRKNLILEELRGRDADILCLQEIDQDNYHEFFRPALAHNGYRGVYWPKSRAKTMNEKEAKVVDGCATFYKDSKYILLDKQLVDFASIAINRPDMKNDSDVFNRVMPRDDIGVVTFFENRQTGARLIVAQTHMYWHTAYADVKVVQVAILLEQIAKFAEGYAKQPACKDKMHYRYANHDAPDGLDKPADPIPEPGPSQEYANGASIPLILCGDFNSTAGSGVCNLITAGSLPRDHPDLSTFKYGNFTRDGMAHPFALKSAYSPKEMPFTNYTPGFTGILDYIWYSAGSLAVTGLLGQVDKAYLQRVPGFPNWHYPSDHLALLAEFSVKPRKERKVVEADFGPQKGDGGTGGRGGGGVSRT